MIYITGIAGFVGSNLANTLHELGYPVTGCDNLQFGYAENVTQNIKFDRRGFEDINIKADVLVHCATVNLIYSQGHEVETFRTNALNTIDLFNRFKGKIIYTSTASVYGNAKKLPTPEDCTKVTCNSYDQSKLIAEKYLHRRGNYTTLRLSNVYGKNQHPGHPYSGVIGKFIGRVKKGLPVEIIGDGIDTRDFTYVKDVVSAIIKAINAPAFNTEINIASGIENSIIKVAHDVHDILGKEFKAEFIEKRSIDGISRRWLDIEKAKDVLNWQPEYSLKEGIKDCIDCY